MPETPEQQRLRLGRIVEGLRTDRGWSKEEAARTAHVSSITWKRVEDGLRVQDVKLVAVLRALDITADDLVEIDVTLLGTPPLRQAAPGREVVRPEGDPLADVRFRRPEGMGDDEWLRTRAQLNGYWAALLDQAERER